MVRRSAAPDNPNPGGLEHVADLPAGIAPVCTSVGLRGRIGREGPPLRAYPDNYKEPRCDENEMAARKADDGIPWWYGEEA